MVGRPYLVLERAIEYSLMMLLRGSSFLYILWPNPMMSSLAFHLASKNLFDSSTEPIVSSIFMAASFAPPWRGPLSVPIALVIPL